MFFKKPLAKGYNVILTKLNIGAAAPDFTLPNHSGESWRLAKRFQSQYALLVCSIAFA
jgi:hypothetical protein